MKSFIAIDEFIASRERGSHEQPTHYRLVMTLFGIYGRPAGTAIPVAVAIKLLTELGYEPTSIRSSISRLKNKGVLTSKKTIYGNGYALSENLEPHMIIGDERIFSPRPMGLNDSWLLVSFSVPESQRQIRHKIRIGLARIGFGTVGPGLYIGPARLQAETIEYIREHNFWDYIEMFICQPSSLGDLREKVSRWWNLDALEHEYQAFINTYQAEAKKWQSLLREGNVSYQEAFKLYLPMITSWRRLPFLDPGLPIELLPENWVGITAGKLFNDLHRIVGPLSAQHFKDVMAVQH